MEGGENLEVRAKMASRRVFCRWAFSFCSSARAFLTSAISPCSQSWSCIRVFRVEVLEDDGSLRIGRKGVWNPYSARVLPPLVT